MKACLAYPVVGFVALVAVLSAPAQAAEFRLPGGRATAMGGAGVAGTRGAWATYYNPAALADRDGIRTRGGLGVHVVVRDSHLITPLDRLNEYDWDAIVDDPPANAADALAVADIILNLRDDAALLVGAGGALYAQIDTFGFGVMSDVQAGLIPMIDRERLVIAEPADPLSIANNTSEIRVRALLLTEIPLAYGHRFETDAGTVDVGGALKLMRGLTYDGFVSVTDGDADAVEDRLRSSDKESTAFGVDLGLLYHVPSAPVRVGVLARNINAPTFDTWDGGAIKEGLQVRAGFEVAVVDDWLVVAADADLTENDTVMQGSKSRLIGLGVGIEGYPDIFAGSLRLGVLKNVAESDTGMMFTGGLGFGVKWFNLTLSGAVSTKETTFDGETFPSEARMAMALETAW